MAAEMLQNVIQSQDLLMRGFPRKGSRPRKSWMETAFDCSFMDVDERIVKGLQEMKEVADKRKRKSKKKKKFRTFVRKGEEVVEIPAILNPKEPSWEDRIKRHGQECLLEFINKDLYYLIEKQRAMEEYMRFHQINAFEREEKRLLDALIETRKKEVYGD